MAEKSDGDGKMLLEILDSWPRMGKLLLLTLSIAAIFLATAYLIVSHLPANASEVQIGASHILFRQPTKDGVSSLLVVSPQGWTRTSIRVREDEYLRIQAGGRVYIDLAGLNKALAARERIAEDVKKRVKAPEGTYAPEDYFTDAEKAEMTPRWPWTGPDGVPVSDMRKAGANLQRWWARSILKDQGYGTLVGAFSESDEEQEPTLGSELAKKLAEAAFRVGSSYDRKATANRKGYLYFTVNEVQYDRAPDFFFVDNIGSYYVKVEVSYK